MAIENRLSSNHIAEISPGMLIARPHERHRYLAETRD
jgi:hypothetical protein